MHCVKVNDQISKSFSVRVIVRELLVVFGLFFWLGYTKGHVCNFYSNVYLILVAVDVSDFADSDLVGVWLREKLFFWSRFPGTCVFCRYIVGWWDLFWSVIVFFEMV